MGRIRYGAKSPEEMRNRELEATTTPTWATVLTAVFETDPDVVAAVLPPPLEPSGEALAKVTLATVDMGRGIPVFGAGTFAVQARHEDTVGYYPLVMPMTTEQAVVGGRETYGEPKKLGQVTLERDGDRVRGVFARMGVEFVEVTGTVGPEQPLPPDDHRVDFYLKFLLDPSGKGFDAPPSLVHCHRDETTRKLQLVDGEVVLRESRFDPVADIPVLAVRSIELGERSTVQRGEIVGTVDGDALMPYVHQRYDDLSVTGGD
jgi:acetoacetate decarboxylase